MPFERLVHAEVGLRRDAADGAFLGELELEDLEEAIVAADGEPAVLRVPADAAETDAIRNGDLSRRGKSGEGACSRFARRRGVR
jgi:hypothetical protein